MLKFILALTTILLNSQLHSAHPASVTLLAGSEYRCCPSEATVRDLPTVYCYRGSSKSLLNIWQTVAAFVETKRPEKYEIYQGADESEVWTQYESSQSKWGFSMFDWGRRSVVLTPFNTTCFGIRTSKNYTLKLQVTRVDKMLVGMFTLGALLFFLAPVLVHNQIFFYVAGVTIGVCIFVLVLLYFVISLLPLKRPAMIGVMAGGSTVIFYFFQSFVNHVLALMPVYTQLVYGYLVVTGFISFVVCYRFGPLTHPRSKDIIQWSLQIFSLVLVFFSSYNKEATATFCVLIALLYKFPFIKRIINTVRSKVQGRNRRPAAQTKPRLLTLEEYREQGRVETERGLEEIRRYCRTSPQKWDIIRRRIESGNMEKFAQFMIGGSHVSKEEMEAKMREESYTSEEE